MTGIGPEPATHCLFVQRPLVIERDDNDASRPIAWVMFHDLNADQWAVAGPRNMFQRPAHAPPPQRS
jgi:hypothetical protein